MKIILTIIFSLFIFSFSSFAVYANDESKLILNRIMIDPTSCSDFDCEWIELKNISEQTLDLSSYKYNGTIMKAFTLLSNERVIIAKELIDGSDADLESFEARWGNNSGIWGDSPIEFIKAIDDSEVGISINLSNTGGTIVLEKVDETETTSFSWDNKYIAYYNFKNSYYGFKDETVLGLEWIHDSIAPVIELKINDTSSKDQLTTQITSKTLNFDLADSIDNTHIVEVNTNVDLNGVNVFHSSSLNFDYGFDQISTYTITAEVTDLNNNKSYITNYINVLESFNNLKLNEVFTGKDEKKGWIEFINNNDFELNLGLYSIEYDGVRSYFVDNTKLKLREYFVLDLLDTVNPYQCLHIYQFDELIDELCIEDQIMEKSYNRDFEDYYLATMTKGYENVSDDEDEEDTNNDKVYSIEEVTDSLINKSIKIRGVVNSNTNLFNKDYIYLQKDDKAIKVNIKDIDYKFKFGDEIIVIGIISKDSESKFSIKASSIELSTTSNKIEPKKINADNLVLENEGILVLVSGRIDKSSGNEFYLIGFDKFKVVVLEEWGILKKKGDSVIVKGVLSYYKYGGEIKYILFPVAKESVIINQVLSSDAQGGQVLSVSTQNADDETLPNAGMSSYIINLIFAGLVTLITLRFRMIKLIGK